jgi:alanine-glyoxylate transaminase / serine-glyoxylate transaminase / serine-pyruvate transaminase
MSSQNPVFIPGPSNIPERLRRAIDVPTIDHRSDSFAELFRPLFAGVRKVMKSSDAEVIFFPATGTAGWEAAITNTLSPGDRVLAARHGMFSQRWIALCRRHGLDVQTIEAPWGAGCPVDAMGEALTRDVGHRIKAVLVTHNETATGVRSDVAGVRHALEAAVTGSQNGFMLPAGLAILGVSQKAVAAMDTATCPRCYLDLRDMLMANAKGGYPYTPPVNLLYGLGTSLEMLDEEGLENVFARHQRIAEGVRRAVAAWGLELCARSPDLYSDTVSAIVVPDGFDGTKIVTHAAEKYGTAFGVGLGEVAGKVFRIGHLGSLTDVMALAGLACAEMAMADLGLPVRLGSGVAAAQEHFSRTGSKALSQAA